MAKDDPDSDLAGGDRTGPRRHCSTPPPAGAVRALALVFLAALAALSASAATWADQSPGCGADECVGSTPVVPSLDPGWSASFVPPTPARVSAPAACTGIPTDVIAYTPTDWLRFAQKMAANMSPCANYYVSIPPVKDLMTGDKTMPRPNQASVFHTMLPSNVHPVNEVEPDAWTNWVAAHNGSWYDAGVTARQLMLTVGGFAADDLWAVNELSSAVRQGTGPSRENMRDFVHGLHDGDGGPPVQGIVFVVNFGEATVFFDTYRANVKSWLGDTAFWADMSLYVRFFSQEVYGRIDRWAVPGTMPEDRLTPTADYLEHFANFAAAGAYSTVDPAAAYLATADAPIGNAAWSNGEKYGWPSPAVDSTLASAYVAGQVYAFRHEQAGRPSESFGFAWQPTNPGLPTTDFNNRTAAILDRIAAAIHASDAPSSAPGLSACGSDLSWCAGDLAGATFNTGWRIFHDWTQPIAESSSVVVQENTPATIPLSAVDPDPQQLTFSIVGSPSHGTATTDGSASVAYVPAPVYAGADAFTFRVSDGWMTSTATVTIKVNAPPIVDAGPDLTMPWGVPVTLAGTATDPDGNPNGMVADWSFGDGTTGTMLEAAHTYTEPGTYTATLTVTDADGGVASDTVVVTVVPRASSLTITTTPTLDITKATVTATFADAVDPATARLENHAVHFQTGAATCTATTSATGGASCTLPAAALALGPSTVTARFDGDPLYTANVATGAVLVYAMPTGGIFAIGDVSTTGGVTFWSPSWSLLNTLSGGSAPPSFKGFATTPVDTGWLAPPGFDHVPTTVPEWMAVLLANRVTKVGDTITVTTTRTVVVHVATYDPALAGQGAIVATIG
jgi:PKD repeat protein